MAAPAAGVPSVRRGWPEETLRALSDGASADLPPTIADMTSADEPSTTAATTHADPLREAFVLDGCVVDVGAHRVRRGDDVLKLEPKAMATLVCLARAAGRTLSRDEILEAVWPGRVLTDDALNRIISLLRQTFGDDPRNPRLIETIPKAGYRLLQTPTPLPSAAPPPETAAQPSAPADEAAAPASAAMRTPRNRWRPAMVATLALLALLWWWQGDVDEGAEPDRVAGAPRLRPMLGLPGPEYQPAYSPDGRRLAFSWGGPDGSNRDIYVLDAGSREPRRLTDDPLLERAPAFAADGLSLVYVQHGETSCRILRIGVDGGTPQPLAECSLPTVYPLAQLGADGETLYYDDAWPSASDPHRVLRKHLPSGRVEPVTAPPPGLSDLFPALSADGRNLVFSRGIKGGIHELWTQELAAGTGSAVQRSFDGALTRGAVWTPDGDLIVVSRRGGDAALWWLQGEQWRWIGVGHGQVQSPRVRPDGRQLAFERWQHDTELHWFQAEQGVQRLAGGADLDQTPTLAADGERIAYASNRSGEWEIRLLQGGQDRRLLATGQQRPDWLRFSRDAQRLAFLLSGAEASELCVLPIEATTPNCHRQPALSLAWDADERALLFAASVDGRCCDLQRISLLDGSVSTVLADAGPGIGLDPAGSLLFTHASESGLWRLQGDGQRAQVIAGLPPTALRNWLSDGAETCWWRGGELVCQRHGETAERVLHSQPGIDIFSGLQRAPDGRFLFSASVRTDSDIMLLDDWR